MFLSFLAWSFVAVAQETKIPQRLELVTVDLQVGDDDSFLSVEEKAECTSLSKVVIDADIKELQGSTF